MLTFTVRQIVLEPIRQLEEESDIELDFLQVKMQRRRFSPTHITYFDFYTQMLSHTYVKKGRVLIWGKNVSNLPTLL